MYIYIYIYSCLVLACPGCMAWPGCQAGAQGSAAGVAQGRGRQGAQEYEVDVARIQRIREAEAGHRDCCWGHSDALRRGGSIAQGQMRKRYKPEAEGSLGSTGT